MWLAAHPQTSTHPTLPKNLAISTIARINDQSAGQSRTHNSSLIANHCPIPQFLIATRPGLEIKVTRSQQTRKHFLIATFFGTLPPAPRLTHHSSLITHHCLTPFLFDTNKTHRIIILMRTLLKTNEKQFSIRYKLRFAILARTTNHDSQVTNHDAQRNWLRRLARLG
jgi:hypothetical protein